MRLLGIGMLGMKNVGRRVSIEEEKDGNDMKRIICKGCGKVLPHHTIACPNFVLSEHKELLRAGVQKARGRWRGGTRYGDTGYQRKPKQ